MTTNIMQSELDSLIKRDLPGAIITETRTTFQNCLIKTRIDNKFVYIKMHSSPEHYYTERRVLRGLRDLAPAFIRYPLLLKYRDELRAIIMSEVTGQSLRVNHAQLAVIAQGLSNFHTLRGITGLEEVDIAKRMKLYQENIVSAETLATAERTLALKASTKLAAIDLLGITKINQLIHGDLNAGNMLYDDTQDIPLAFIDFERTAWGCGMADIAKFVWRVLQSDMLQAHEFLALYLQKSPTASQKKELYFYMLFEYLGAISYFAYRGHKENYPYKDEAFNLLEPCLALL